MRTLPLIALLLFACTKENDPKDDTDTGSDTSEDTDSGSADVVPNGGNYTISSSINHNACGDWGPSFNDSINGFELKITFPDDDTARFHWVNVQDCPRDGAMVTCSTDEPLVLDDYAPDNDARIMYEDVTSLTWETAEKASGSWTVDLSCEGSQCELIAEINEDTYPCTIFMNWDLTRNSQ